jgi:uncharacterized paraquat-inducible protein A
MKSVFIAIFAMVAFATASFAAAPETMTFKRNVPFSHKAHAEKLKDCTKCHSSAEGGKIDGFGKDWAHKKCKECHVEMQKGPTTCKACHK